MSNSTRNQHKTGRIVLTTLVIFALLVVVFLFTGCATPASSTPDPAASSAAAPAEEPAPVDDGNYAFGETASFEDGVSLSLSEGTAFTPSDTAMGQVAGQQFLVYEFVLTNNSEENFDPTLVYATASSGGVEAPGIFDTAANIGFPPSTVVLPGQTIKWTQAFSVADPASITLEVNIGFDKTAIFTNL